MNDDILDISALTPKEREIQLRRPDGNGLLPFWVTLMSPDDPRLKTAQRRLVDKRSEKQRKGKLFSAEEMEREMISLVALSITGWRAEVLYRGEIPEFSRRKAVEMLSDPEIPWFYSQLHEELGDSENFFRS